MILAWKSIREQFRVVPIGVVTMSIWQVSLTYPSIRDRSVSTVLELIRILESSPPVRFDLRVLGCSAVTVHESVPEGRVFRTRLSLDS